MIPTTQYQVNDIVKLCSWSCEGIEPPWGWEYHRFGDIDIDDIKNMHWAFRVKIPTGTIGIIIRDLDLKDSAERHYVMLVAGRQLCVGGRFISGSV